MFIEAVRNGTYQLQIRETSNPALIYIDDCLKAIDLLTHANKDSLTRASYNLFSCSPTAAEIAIEIKRVITDSEFIFEPIQKVADLIDSWPRRIDDAAARRDWGWKPDFQLAEMTREFISTLQCLNAEGLMSVFIVLDSMEKDADHRRESWIRRRWCWHAEAAPISS